MKILLTFTAFTSAVLLSVPAGKVISKLINHKRKETEIENTELKEFDLSLRNFHPNKGE